jgi:diguanylate cyclase (GGDEF)-like protein/PAS domain S-box-containing protein
MDDARGAGSLEGPAASLEARALEVLGVGLLVGDGERLLHVSPAAALLFGRSAEELLDLGQVRSLLHPDDERRISAVADAARAAGEPIPDRFTVRIVRPDGTLLPVELRVRAEVRGDEVRTYSLVSEVGELWTVREGLARLALTDPMTQLPNRLAFEQQLASVVDELGRTPAPSLLLFCDVDGLKGINDSAGHAAGDQALIEVARRLARTLREGDVAARLGGDEFVALLPRIGRASVAELVERVRRATTFTMRFEGRDLEVAPSIGWVEFADGDRSPEELLKAADASMYEAKRVRRRR